MSHDEKVVTRVRHTRHRILLAAARVLARLEATSMADIAAEADITRGTLYRHFPSRESLVRALEATANEEAGSRLAEANLGQVDVAEGLARAIRALVTVGSDFIILLRERRPPEPGFTAPLEALLERGRAEGQIRTDVPLSTLVESLLALVAASVRTGRPAGMGLEDMSSTALQLFLAGARAD